MSELNTSVKKSGKKYLQKQLRVDLTPMVDLGFLLITFFILTTSMLEPTVMKLIMPDDTGQKTFLTQSTTITFILEGHDSIGYYDGLAKEIKYTSFGSMRSIIQRKKIDLVNNHIDKNKLTMIIKPAATSTYKNFIDALDEITINDCRHYYITEPEKDEVL